MRHIFLTIALFTSACCTSDDKMCVASATDTDDRGSSGDSPTEPGGACCVEHGKLDGYDICAISEAPMCVGCDGKPVLCMTTGCGVPFAEDCCLVGGETVTCPR